MPLWQLPSSCMRQRGSAGAAAGNDSLKRGEAMDVIGWLMAFVILIVIEVATTALTTVWFAGGAFAAFFAALAGVPVKPQLLIFITVSFVLLIFTRPFVLKYIKRDRVRTNVESLVGRKAKVTVEINNDLSAGAAVLDGQEWTARSYADEVVIPAGHMVVVTEIRGVKLIVKEMKEGK